jgi:hypothetical protein
MKVKESLKLKDLVMGTGTHTQNLSPLWLADRLFFRISFEHTLN